MLKRKIENLLKMDTEFGGAEPHTDGGGAEPQEIIEEPGADPIEGTPPAEEPQTEPQIDLTEEMRSRINRIRAEESAKVRAAEERARKLEEDLSGRNTDHMEFLSAQGQTNPYTGRPIDSLAEFRAYKTAYKNEQSAEEGPDIEALVSAKVAEATRAQQAQITAEQRLSSDLAKISRLNPSIKSSKDIEALPEAETIIEKIGRGYSLHDAYVTSVKAQVPKPKADTKGHMQTLSGGTGGGDTAQIPAHELESWKEDFPKDTLEQLTQRYNRAVKA